MVSVFKLFKSKPIKMAWFSMIILTSLSHVIVKGSFSTSFHVLEPASKPVTCIKPPLNDPPYYKDPGPKDLDPKKLQNLLGADYNAEYTALTESEVQKRRKEELLRSLKDINSPDHDIYRKILVKSMPQHIRDLDFTMPGLRRSLGPRASRKLQLWLWKMSSCPVFSKWKHFGVRYWPPYRNVGRCGKKRSCSFPRGMKCKKAGTKTVPSLRWICFNSGSIKCRWAKIDLAVITRCQCTCAHNKTDKH